MDIATGLTDHGDGDSCGEPRLPTGLVSKDASLLTPPIISRVGELHRQEIRSQVAHHRRVARADAQDQKAEDSEDNAHVSRLSVVQSSIVAVLTSLLLARQP